MSLKKELIRLGQTNPELRTHIKPVLDSLGTNTKKADAEAQKILDAVEDAENAPNFDAMIETFMRSYGTDSIEVSLDILSGYSDRFLRELGRVLKGVL